MCSQEKIRSYCFDDYSNSNKDQNSYQPEWKINKTDEEYSSTILKAFEYQSKSRNNDGYFYELRGRLSDMKSNLSRLHQLSWINNQTRFIFIQLTLFNPNVQLFTSIRFQTEFLSVGSIDLHATFQPIQFYSKYLFSFC